MFKGSVSTIHVYQFSLSRLKFLPLRLQLSVGHIACVLINIKISHFTRLQLSVGHHITCALPFSVCLSLRHFT